MLLSLFITMLKIGAFTFGGGYAMLALLENEFVTKRAWLDKEELLDVIAIAESTPGPIAINAATYVGYKKKGVLGAIIATLGMVLPSFTIIYLISLFFDAFLSLEVVSYAFAGIRICVIYLILSAGFKMIKGMKKTPLSIGVMTATLVVMVTLSLFAVHLSSILYILIGGTIGLTVYLVGRARKGAKK